MGHHGVETDVHGRAFAAIHVMLSQNLIGNCVFTGLVFGERSLFCDSFSIKEKYSF